MRFDALSHKLNHLNDHVASPTREMITSAMQLHLDAMRDELVMPETLRSALTIDVLYILFRHRIWISTPIFAEIMIEFITTEYRIPQKLVRPLIEDAIMTMTALLPDQLQMLTDKDFLEYLFVLSATADSEVELVLDLGIGERLVRTLKSAATADSSPSFVPEIDANIAEIMLSMANQAKEIPWIVDVYRLRYEMLNSGVMSYCGTRLQIAFDTAAHIGSRQAIDHEAILRWIGSHNLEEGPAAQMLEDLIECEVIYCSDQRAATKSRQATAKYSLTHLGHDFTALCYVRRYFHRVKDPLKKLQTLPDLYQKAAIEQLDDYELMVCMLEDHDVHLTPAGHQAALKLIIAAGATDQALQIIERTLANSKNPWLRKASWESLIRLNVGQDLGKLLPRLEYETSPLVKQAAVATFMKVGKPEFATEWMIANPLA